MTSDNNTPNDAEWWWDQAALLIWEALCWWPIWLPVAWLATIGRWAASSLIAAGAPELVGWPAAIVVTAPLAAWCWLRRLPITDEARRSVWERRRIAQALITVGVASRSDGTRVGEITETAAGWAVDVRLAPPRTTDDLERHCGSLAEIFGVLKVTATRTAPGTTRLALRARDPLAWTDDGPPWPLLATIGPRSLTKPVPAAVTDDGEILTVDLWCSTVLIGGSSGSGKSSSALWPLTLGAALDPLARLWAIDAKDGMELIALNRCGRLDRFATDHADAVSLLGDLLAETKQRQRSLARFGLRQIPADSRHWRPIVLVIDELAEITAGADRALNNQAKELLRRLLATGRAAGLTVIAATQRPSADLIDSNVRDLFAWRWAMRTARPSTSTMILGDVAVADGAEPHSIPTDPTHTGVGCITDGGTAIRVRGYHIDGAAIAAATPALATWRSWPWP